MSNPSTIHRDALKGMDPLASSKSYDDRESASYLGNQGNQASSFSVGELLWVHLSSTDR
jgi:hypothetical protein